MNARKIIFVVVFVISVFGLHESLRAQDDLIIYDNDWNVPGSYMEQNALMPLLTSSHVKVIGLTSVTGDCWRDEGTASLLRYLEVIGETDIPVYNGAVFPLVNTRERMKNWEQAYGFVYWKGAWNDIAKFPKSHPDEPYKIVPPLDKMPQIKPATEIAANYLIQAVHEHPHQITIIAGGPLTDLAIAITLDPEFAGLAKRLVFFGGVLRQLTDGNAGGFHSDFNIIFDPEAAHIVLAAHWAKIISVADVTDDYILDKDLLGRIQAHPSPAGDYMAQNSRLGLPLWSEVMNAIVADPTLVTKSVDATMDVDIDHGMNYGRTVIGPINANPHLGPSNVTIVQAIDGKRFTDEFVAAMQTDLRTKSK